MRTSAGPGPETTRTHVTMVLYGGDPIVLERSVAAVERQTVRVTLHIHDNARAVNLGFARAHNLLLADAFLAGAQLVVVHNPDLALNADAVEILEAEAKAHPHRLLGPVLERSSDEGEPTGLGDTRGIRWTRDGRHLDIGHGLPLVTVAGPPQRVAGVSGACLAVPRAAYEHIVEASGEFFDEDFFAYREDAELAVRAQLLGVESWIVPAARGLHVRTQRGTTRGANPQIDLLGVRNRFLIAFKWGRRRPGFLPLVLFRDLVVVGAVILKERSSLPGLAQAWRLRGAMRAKRRRVLQAAEALHRLTP